MRIVSHFLVIILIYGVIGFINYRITYFPQKHKVNQVHLPKIFCGIGLLCAIVFTSLFIINYLLPQICHGMTWWSTGIFIMFILLGLILMIQYTNCRIDIGKDEFVYHTFFGRKYIFQYSEIKKVRRTKDTIHLYTIRKHLYIDSHAEGIDEFFVKFKWLKLFVFEVSKYK